MKILYAIDSFVNLTGAEMYVYELAREMISHGHQVMISAPETRLGGEIVARATQIGAGIAPLNGRLRPLQFDIIHASEPGPTQFCLNNLVSEKFFCSIHSQWDLENPIPSPRILKYICIREEIQEKIIRANGIPAEKTIVIMNGIDLSRFNKNYVSVPHPEKRVLMVGTIDPLRATMILDLIRRKKNEGFDLWICGAVYLPKLIGQIRMATTLISPRWNIEEIVKECDQTAGIQLGRSTIEGWACGKSGWIYEIDLAGNIIRSTLYDPPADMQRFDIKYMAEKIFSLYNEP